MKIKFSLIISLLLFLTSLTGISIADDNAFGSLVTPKDQTTTATYAPSPETVDKTLHPLLQNAVGSNTLMAIMISPSMKIGLIRTTSGDEYFVRVGDLIGNSEGKITNITSSGIEVTEKEEVISLIVRNRSVANDENAE
jgi:type IV pilus assembly protein PilP